MIKDKYPQIIIQYHGHSGPGLSMASILEVCNNGADIIDTAIEPLSWGKVHPDVISVISMLKNEGFEVPEINMSAYMKARAMTQEFIDEWLGYFINPGNKIMSSLLLGCGLPGGMMGSMMADLGGMRQTINNIRKKKGEEELSMDDLLIKALRRGRVCMATRRLSSIGNPIQPVCKEHLTDEPPHHGAGQGPLRNDGRLYVGYDSR